MKPKISVGILLFNEVEVLDFAGPFEVFAVTEDESKEKLFQVKTISETGNPISARNGLKVIPDYKFEDEPEFEILLIPGGYGAEEIEIHNPTVIEWIQRQQKQVKTLASICTGALLLAEAGLLNHKKATTHWMDLDRLEKDYPQVEVVRGVKYVDEGDLLTSGGISAGINLSFHLVKRLFGSETAKRTAKRMEYDIVI